jgi:hypothetical protein
MMKMTMKRMMTLKRKRHQCHAVHPGHHVHHALHGPMVTVKRMSHAHVAVAGHVATVTARIALPEA